MRALNFCNCPLSPGRRHQPLGTFPHPGGEHAPLPPYGTLGIPLDYLCFGRMGRTFGSAGTYSEGCSSSVQATQRRPQSGQKAHGVEAGWSFAMSSGTSALVITNHSSDSGSSAFQRICAPDVHLDLAVHRMLP